MSKPKKIVIAGLDNCGKTSIVLNLIGKINLMNYLSLSPTIGADIIDYTIGGSEFNIWDLGGQTQFRIEYITDFMSYFKGIEKLIFVIDIQDTDRYNLALEYLKSIIKEFEKNDLKLGINVFLHKMDPNMESLNRELVEDLVIRIKDILPKDFYTEIYESTIYTTFEKRIII